MVSFGEDGTIKEQELPTEYFDQEGSFVAIPIYNNNTFSINAYAMVYPTETKNRLKITTSSGSNYYDVEDTTLVGKSFNKAYSWSLGHFENTCVRDNFIYQTGSGGNYVSPVYDFIDNFKASYFYLDATIASGTSCTLEVMGSDISPESIEELYIPTNLGIVLYNTKDNSINTLTNESLTGSTSSAIVSVNKNNGDIITVCYVNYYSHWQSRAYRYNRNGILLSSTDGYIISYYLKYGLSYFLESVGRYGYWGYGKHSAVDSSALYVDGSSIRSLIHISADFNTSIYELNMGYTDFVQDMSADLYGDGLWFINKTTNRLIHLNGVGTETVGFVLKNAKAVCSDIDGGCWVFETSEKKVLKYNNSGDLLSSNTLNINIDVMKSDFYGGFWCSGAEGVFRFNGSGGMVVSNTALQGYNRMWAGRRSIVLQSLPSNYDGYTNNFDRTPIIILDTVTGNLKKTIYLDEYTNVGIPTFFTLDYTEDTTIEFPTRQDQVWGENGSLVWKEVNINGELLPRNRYYRAKISLEPNSTILLHDTFVDGSNWQHISGDAEDYSLGYLKQQGAGNVVKTRTIQQFQLGDCWEMSFKFKRLGVTTYIRPVYISDSNMLYCTIYDSGISSYIDFYVIYNGVTTSLYKAIFSSTFHIFNFATIWQNIKIFRSGPVVGIKTWSELEVEPKSFDWTCNFGDKIQTSGYFEVYHYGATYTYFDDLKIIKNIFSPFVENIKIGSVVELDNIQPNAHKDIFVKSAFYSTGDEDSYISNILVSQREIA